MISRRPFARFSRGRIAVRGIPPPAPPDTGEPLLVSATIPVDGLSVVLSYHEALDETSTPDPGDYALAGTASVPDSVLVSGSTVTITLDTAVFDSETVTLDYTAGAAPVRDLALNEADDLVAEPVTNNSEVSGDAQAPLLLSATIAADGLTTVLVYDEALDEASVPDPSDYAYSGTVRTVTAVDVTGDTVTLTNSGAIAQGATVTLDYTAGAAPVRDLALNDADDLDDEPVTNNSTSDQTAPVLSSATIAIDGLSIALLYNETLDAGSVPAAGAYSLGGTTSTVGSVGISGSTVTLTMTSGQPIYSTETVTVSYTAGGAPVQDAAGNDAANLSGQATTNNSTVVANTVIITRFSNLTSNYPAKPCSVTGECWGGGGGGTTATSAGGGGAYAKKTYNSTASGSLSISIGAGGAAGGGSGGDTTLDSTVCVADGAAGNTRGLASASTGDVTRDGADGVVGTGNSNGGGSPGSSTGPSGFTPGEPGGAPGAQGNANNASKIPGAGGRSSGSSQFTGAAGLARLTYTEPADPNYAVLVGAAITRSTANGTSHTAVVPSGNDGDQLVYIVGADGAPTIGVTGADGTIASSAAAGAAIAAFRETVSGSPPTEVTTSASEQVDIMVLRFRSAGTPTGTAANGTGFNADPPSHDAGSSAPYVWVTAACVDSTTTSGDITGRPTNYDESLYIPPSSPASSIALLVAWRRATSQTENPGAFTSQSGDNASLTIAVPRA